METQGMSEKLKKKLAQGRQFRRNDMHPELRASEVSEGVTDPGMFVEGHASTFNEPYELGRYYDAWQGTNVIVKEQIESHAFDECDMSDVIMQYDHEGRVLARSRNNTLEVKTDDKGLFIRADLSKSELGPGLYKDIKNGIIDRMSFAFTVNEDNVEKTEDKVNHVVTVLRTITKIGKLYDVSAVSLPANDGTDISARGYCDGVIADLIAERLEVQKKSRKKKALALRIRIDQGKE